MTYLRDNRLPESIAERILSLMASQDALKAGSPSAQWCAHLGKDAIMLHPGRPLKGRALIDALETGPYAAYARRLAAECAAEDSTLLYDDGEGVYGLRNRLFQRLDQAKEAYGGVFTAIKSLMRDDDAIALAFLAARPAASTHNTRVTEAPLNVLLALFDALNAVGSYAAYAHQLAAEYAAEIG